MVLGSEIKTPRGVGDIFIAARQWDLLTSTRATARLKGVDASFDSCLNSWRHVKIINEVVNHRRAILAHPDFGFEGSPSGAPGSVFP